MGRYGDEIKRITREQSRKSDAKARGSTDAASQGSAAPGDDAPAPADGDRAEGHGADGHGADGNRASGGRGPLIALLAVVALAGLGWLVVRQMMADSKLQDCVMSGRKNCVPSQ
jgi:hypothetical protein